MTLLRNPAKRLALAVLAAGLCTAFAPVFSTRAGADWFGWTPWLLASRIAGRHVDVLDVVFNQTLFGLVSVYALMLCGLVALVLPRPRRALVTIALFGSLLGYEPFYWIQYNSGGRLFRALGVVGVVRYEPAMYLLAVVMPMLLWVAWSGPWEPDRGTAREGRDGAGSRRRAGGY